MFYYGPMSLTAHSPIPAVAFGRFPVVPAGLTAVECGFPSPAQDYEHNPLDIEDLLIRDKVSTFFLRVSGFSMLDAGITDGDVVVVDRGIEPAHGDVVLAVIDGGFFIKRLVSTKTKKALSPANPAYEDLLITEETDVIIWGVITRCIHMLRPPGIH